MDGDEGGKSWRERGDDANARPDHLRALEVVARRGANADSSFYGSIAAGTPPISYNVILDTGSSDFCLAANDGLSASQSDGIPTCDANATDRAQRGETLTRIPFSLLEPGFEVSDQVFGVVTQISNILLTPPVSGLMGLGFKSISSSNAQALEPGGMVNCGAVNTSLYEYTGDIHYQHIPEATGSRTWLAPPCTTLVGCPVDSISALYAQIPGSETLTGNSAGYYTYPCGTNVTVTMKFGDHSISWPISNADLLLMQVSVNSCVGTFVQLATSGMSAPPWIIGDTFLKNVYSVFRVSPVIPITGSRSYGLRLKFKRTNRNGTRSDTERFAVKVRESCGVGQAC
ncbi:acid protease [Lentinus brumalis]|uniref:Acid protease n=1 Tax=Lentinus brumalis TaxID=2498619 RepID=A0A371DN73_9APHY|nr:acid protease [Polyporus brumalis]